MSEQTSSTPGEAPGAAEAPGVNGVAAEASAEAPATSAEAPAAEAPAASAEAPAATASEGGSAASTADLANLIEGKSDDEILAVIKERGEDSVFGGVFDEMAKRFLPGKAVGKNVVIQYDITTPDGTHSYQVVVSDGTCTTGPGAGQEASVTLALSAPDFLRLISGKLNGMSAFMSGKLKLKGDMMLAQSMQTWFDAS
jgi:putative sterol carrier protein